MAAAATARLNDVNLDAVVGLATRIQEEPDAGATTWRADVKWKGAFRSEATVREFDPVPSDEPDALGGDDRAANPVEQLLGALGNCLAVGYAANAAAAGIAINDLDIAVEGDLDLHTFLGLRDGNAGYQDIRVQVYLDADASQEQLDELHVKVTRTSPVGHTLSRSVPLQIHLA